MMPVARTPLEGSGGPGPAAAGGASISLAMLIEFIVQRTYHELTVLAELLPRKNDMERKIEIVQYASRTRQLCIRLLALVKWAGSVSKVDKSASIMAFLDKQSMLFVDTADKLSLMARQDLTAARLPMFHIPSAVEVLTTGNYSRLPLCVRERIVPQRPVTAGERCSTLLRLNQIIEHRLVTSDVPPQMLQLRIANGRVRMTVEDEFSVTLTLLGDGASVPWTLLEIDILVEDTETGRGRSLVHPLQVRYLHQLVGSYLCAVDAARPLYDVYHVLHTLCQGLQLEVLNAQLQQLCRDRLGDNVRPEQYVPGRLLALSYWRHATGARSAEPKSYRITLQADPTDSARPLAVSHLPPLPASTDAQLRAVKAGALSLERLVVGTIQLRSRALLGDLRTQLAPLVGLAGERLQLSGSPPALSVPLLQPCLRGEQLLISVHVHRGTLHCQLPLCLAAATAADELASALNSGPATSPADHVQLRALIGRLRFRLALRRAEKTLENLPASVHESLPLSYPEGHPLGRLPAQQFYVRLHRHPHCVLIVVCQQRESDPARLDYRFHVVIVKPSSIEDGSEDAAERHLPKKYLKVLTFVELDTLLCMQGVVAELEPAVVGAEEPVETSRKRRLSDSAQQESGRAQHTRAPAHCVPELAHVVSLCDEHIPCAAMCRELSQRRVAHGGVTLEPDSRTRQIRLLELPAPPSVKPEHMRRFRAALLSANLAQLEDKQGSHWTVEYTFYGPVFTLDGAQRRTVMFSYAQPSAEQTAALVDRILADWVKMAALYGLLLDYQEWVLDATGDTVAEVAAYNYRSATLAYGPNRGATVRVDYCTDDRRFRLTFGIGARSSSATNPHAVMSAQFETLLNEERYLPQLAVALEDTYSPLVSLDKLSATPRLGVRGDRPMEPVSSFILLPQAAWHVRMVYRRVHCLSVHFHSDGLVAVRDGAYSQLERGRHLEELGPMPSLAAFLARYQTDPGFCGLGSEGDGAQSPTSLELEAPQQSGSGPGSMAKPSPLGGSPAAARDARFAHPMTPGSSNPHTPASPLQPSPAPPPPSQLVANSPGNPLHAPSPGGFMPAPSPGGHVVGHSPAAAAMSPFAAQQQIHSPAMAKPPAPPLPPPGASSVAASAPVMLSHEALDALCTRSRLPTTLMNLTPESLHVSPLERYLGCVYMRNHLRKTLDEEAASNIMRLACGEQGVTAFRTACLQCRVRLEPEHVQTLHLSVQPNPDMMEQWTPEQLQTLERFFDTKVAVPPYRQNTLKTFVRILNMQASVLRDFIRIMQLEEMTSSVEGQATTATNWTVEWCTTSPPAVPALIPTGVVSLMNAGSKLLFFLQLTRRLAVPAAGPGGRPPGIEPARLVLPIVYNIPENATQCADRKDATPNQVTTLVNRMMRRSSDVAIQAGECSIFPAVRDVVHGLVLPSEQQQAGPPGVQQVPQGGAEHAGQMMQQRAGPFPQQQQVRTMGGMVPMGTFGGPTG